MRRRRKGEAAVLPRTAGLGECFSFLVFVCRSLFEERGMGRDWDWWQVMHLTYIVWRTFGILDAM